jgi:hypothetical protein
VCTGSGFSAPAERLAWLAIDVDLLIAGVIAERSEEEGVRPVPVASGG